MDREMWEKIVPNLLSNAFKFTPKGHITVQLKRSADSQHGVLFALHGRFEVIFRLVAHELNCAGGAGREFLLPLGVIRATPA
jgi:hypothetical protein